MEKRPAFILSIIITSIIALDVFFLSTSKDNAEEAVITRVIDGDTLILDGSRTVRLLNINAPEKNMPNSVQSRLYLESFMNKTILVRSSGIDKYHRELARLYGPDYINLNLVQKGLASKFLVDNSELNKFYRAESSAIQEGLGIWNHSVWFGCLNISIDKKSEIVILSLLCNTSTKSWYLKDESRKVYKFDEPFIGIVELHSAPGQNNATVRFWDSGDVWNDDRDSIYIFDKENNIVYSSTYGY